MLYSKSMAFGRGSCCEISKVTRCIGTQVSGSLHKRTVEMVEALYTTNKVSLLWSSRRFFSYWLIYLVLMMDSQVVERVQKIVVASLCRLTCPSLKELHQLLD
jgi:hypothetical protein